MKPHTPETALMEVRERAAKKAEASKSVDGATRIRKGYYEFTTYWALQVAADLILKHEEQPVDPDVLALRRLFSAAAIEDGSHFLRGEGDNIKYFQAALAEFKQIMKERGL